VTVAPLNYAFFKNNFMRVYISVLFGTNINYDANLPGKLLKAHDFWTKIALPAVEVEVPGVTGLRVIAGAMMNITWSYNNNGSFNGANIAFQGINLGSIGIIYYFGDDTNSGAAAAPENPQKAEGQDNEKK
jgi:hypothetical protein